PAPQTRFVATGTRSSLPVLYGVDGAIYFRELGRASVRGGLIEARPDWTLPPSVWKPGTGTTLQQMDDPALFVSPGGAMAAGLKPAALEAGNPAAWELYLWRSGKGLAS